MNITWAGFAVIETTQQQMAECFVILPKGQQANGGFVVSISFFKYRSHMKHEQRVFVWCMSPLCEASSGAGFSAVMEADEGFGDCAQTHNTKLLCVRCDGHTLLLYTHDNITLDLSKLDEQRKMYECKNIIFFYLFSFYECFVCCEETNIIPIENIL